MHSSVSCIFNGPTDFGNLRDSGCAWIKSTMCIFYIGSTIVVKLVEMMSNCIFEILTTDVVEKALKSIHEFTFGLPDILDPACFAGYAVD